MKHLQRHLLVLFLALLPGVASFAGEAADNAPHQSHILLNKLCSRSLIPMVCSVDQTHHIIHRDYLLFCISKSFPHGHCSSQPRL